MSSKPLVSGKMVFWGIIVALLLGFVCAYRGGSA